MKVTYRSADGRFTTEIEGNGHAGVWKEVAAFQEVFEHAACGKCGNKNIRFSVRNSEAKQGKNKGKTFTYYELRCTKCGAKKTFGMLDDGSQNLFPRSKDEEGNYLPNGGWVKYNPDTGKEE